MNYKKLLLLACLSCIQNVHAETIDTFTIPFTPSQVKNNLNQDSSTGRNQKAQDAQNQGNDGSAAAIATGVGMVATAIPMIASPLLPIELQGYDLLAKAGMEFAQAGSNAGSATDNGNQKDALQTQDAQQNDAAGNLKQMLSQNPNVSALMEQNGIDPQTFANQLSSGQLTSGAAVAQALGVDTSDFSASSLPSVNFDNNSNPEFGTPNLARVGLDGEEKSSLDGSSSGGSSGVVGAAAGYGGGADSASPTAKTTSPTGQPSTLPSSGGTTVASMPALSRGAKKSGEEGEGAEGAKEGSIWESVLGNLMHGKEDSEEVAAQKDSNRLMTASHLESIGIQPNRAKEHIFQLAHRNYRVYGKWRRDSGRVARN